MRICEAFQEAGFWFRVGDYQFRLTCACGVSQALDACAMSERDGVTVYTCKKCGVLVAGITPDDAGPMRVTAPVSPSTEEGHHMCGYIFGATVDMELWPPAAAEPYLEIPRRPAFFTSRGLA